MQVDTHWPQQYGLITNYAAWLKAVPPMNKHARTPQTLLKLSDHRILSVSAWNI